MASAMDSLWYGDDHRECRSCGGWVRKTTMRNRLCRRCWVDLQDHIEANPATTAPRLLIPAELDPAPSPDRP